MTLTEKIGQAVIDQVKHPQKVALNVLDYFTGYRFVTDSMKRRKEFVATGAYLDDVASSKFAVTLAGSGYSALISATEAICYAVTPENAQGIAIICESIRAGSRALTFIGSQLAEPFSRYLANVSERNPEDRPFIFRPSKNHERR